MALRPTTIAAILVLLLCSASAAPAAQEAPVAGSSVFDSRYLPEYAVDGKPDTRWASSTNGNRPEALSVDLGAPAAIDALRIRWEHAYAAEYEIHVSDDGENWRAVRRGIRGIDGEQLVEGLGATARYLRVWCVEPGPFPLFSIWEISSPDESLDRKLKLAGVAAVEARIVLVRKARERLTQALTKEGIDQIVFAVRHPGLDGHWYANFGYYAASVDRKCYRPAGGKLCRFDVTTGRTSTILEDPQGSIRDPQVHYGGSKIVFSYLKAGTTHFHLYEINADGSGLRQLTDGDCDDIEPTYLPDGGIMFCSSRCNRWVNCWLTQVAVLYRCDADGGNIRMISGNIEHDNTPWVLPDGRVLYMRWEYVDRSQVDYHHLWAANPDGTGQMVFFGNMHAGTAMLDAKPIPGTDRAIAVFSPGHGQREHAGNLAIIDHGDGPDNAGLAKTIPGTGDLRDPYPISEDLFLVARGAELQIVDAGGNAHTFYQLDGADVSAGLWCHEPRLLRSRTREPVIAPRSDLSKATGTLLLADVYTGRNMQGVKRGDIRKLLVLETLPKPINYTGGMDPISYGGTFTLERVVGTVPVEADGSAYLELPALRSFFFVALDEQDMSVKRMQSFLSVQPGEVTGCVGCHEQRTRTVPVGSRPLAVRRAASRIEPIASVPQVIDFPRDVQPVLDRHCVACHDYESTAPGKGPYGGRVILTGDRGPMFSHSYYTLTWKKQFADGRDQARSNLPPRSIGTSASPIMGKLTGGHHGVRASARELDIVRCWIESGAAYPGTYAALGSGMIGGYYENGQMEADFEWPESKAAGEAIGRRCASCHTGPRQLPVNLSDERDVSFWRPDWNDPRLKYARHIMFNLGRPEKSLMLLAPLAKDAGGYGICRAKGDGGEMKPVFTDTDDADYRKILKMCEAGKRRLGEIGRFDMPGFRPPEPYLREMARYGVLERVPEPGEQVDPYAIDEKYWQSFVYRP